MLQDELSFNAVLRKLSDYGFIDKLVSSNGYGMHSCVHSWASTLFSDFTNHVYGILAFTCAGNCLPADTSSSFELGRRVLPHARISARLILDKRRTQRPFLSIPGLEACLKLGHLLDINASGHEAKLLYMRVFENPGSKLSLYQNYLKTEAAMYLAGLYAVAGEFDRAEAFHRRSIHDLHALLGPDANPAQA